MPPPQPGDRQESPWLWLQGQAHAAAAYGAAAAQAAQAAHAAQGAQGPRPSLVPSRGGAREEGTSGGGSVLRGGARTNDDSSRLGS